MRSTSAAHSGTGTSSAVERPSYRPIADYAIIGDRESAALVSRDGSIDWCCLPRFDSGAFFCSLLDRRKGGFFRVAPALEASVVRHYAGDTNVLCTRFETSAGAVDLVDFMPVGRRRDMAGPQPRIFRRVEGLAGSVPLDIVFKPTFDFARAPTAVHARENGAVASSARGSLVLYCSRRLRSAGPGAAQGRFVLAEGEQIWLVLSFTPEREPMNGPPRRIDGEGALAATLRHWRRWVRTCHYRGPHEELVRRSSLTLELLRHEPSGAMVAAPTSSLPERVGDCCNWDYRFCWLRDAGLAVDSLQLVGRRREAEDFLRWVGRLDLDRRGKVHPLYSIDGDTDLAEEALDHLEGYAGSRPVRVGNDAAFQSQLDAAGHVLDAAYVAHVNGRARFSGRLRRQLAFLADQVTATWREPDHAVWEVRGRRRQFVYSKLFCWLALERAIALARDGVLEGDVARWKRVRREVREAILARGFDKRTGRFVRVFGERVTDASVLVMPIIGFLPATDARVRATADFVRAHLSENGLVHRSRRDRRTPGAGAFLLCSFWLVDHLTLRGRRREARRSFERIVALANDVGLLAEEAEPASDRLLGNFPQAYAHLALVRSAVRLFGGAGHNPRRANAFES